MIQRNEADIQAIMQVASQLNEETFEVWPKSSHSKGLSSINRLAFISELFQQLDALSIALYRSPPPSSRSFEIIRQKLLDFAADVPHFELRSEVFRHKTFASFSGDELDYHPYISFIRSVHETGILNSDRGQLIEPGMGEDMPYSLCIETHNRRSSPDSRLDLWRPSLRLCNDFYFYKMEATWITLYFRDEENFLEASLRANNHA